MLNFQDLPDELVLKILGYSETKDLVTCGQVSKRIRRISHDGKLWVTACLVKKIVKTELLEMILTKGCKILNISHCTIVGSLSSNVTSQLRSLGLSHSAWTWNGFDLKTNVDVFEELLFSCCSLQHLKMEGILLNNKMAASICKNGKTLQVLNLNHSYVHDPWRILNENFQAMIKCCQELKEIGLAHMNHSCGLSNIDDNLEFVDNLETLAKNISPNVVKLNLSHQYGIEDYHIKILLSRCSKIKVLSLETNIDNSFLTIDSFKTIRKYLNLTLEELSVGYYGYKPFNSVLELKSMPRLKILNLYYKKKDEEEIQILKQHLPHLMIRAIFDENEGYNPPVQMRDHPLDVGKF